MPPLPEIGITEDQAAWTELQRLASLGTVAGVIAHELNNLMTPVVSYAEMAMHQPDDANLRDLAIRRIAEAARRASEVSRVILEFAQAGGADATESHCDIAEVFRQLLMLLCKHPSRSRITLASTFHVEHPLARIRPIALQQVLLNLYLNAQSAMPGGGAIRVETVHQASLPVPPAGASVGATAACAGPWVVITVADRGVGMPLARLESLWTVRRSDRADGTRGSGLGLVTCRRLVEQAGGGIWAESKPGAGSVFAIVLGAADNSKTT